MTNRFKYKITADDETAKGVSSAKKQLGGLTGAVNRYGKAANQASKGGPGGKKSGLTHVKSAMDQVQRATGKLADTVPGLNRYTSTLGDVHKAASDAAKGIGEAQESGSGLTASLGGIVALGGGAVGVIGALAAGAVKLASGWAEGGAQLGRLSASLGVATDDLQRFQAVGERSGVSKEDTTAAVGGLANTLHEAKFGRNNDALYLLKQLGIGIRTKADGSIDAAAEMYDVADAIASRKDPQTQARIAQMLGVGSALPMLRMGSGELKRRMADAGKYAAIRTPTDIADGSRLYDKGVLVRQLAGRAGMQVDAAAARGGEGTLDATLGAGEKAADRGGNMPTAMAGIVASAGVKALGGAAKWAGGEVVGFGGVVSTAMARIERAAVDGQKKTGVPALVTDAQAYLESAGGTRMPHGSNNPFGIKARDGDPYVEAWTEEQDKNGVSRRVRAKFRKFDSLEDAVIAHDDLLAHGRPYAGARSLMSQPYDYAAAIAPHYASDKAYASKLTSEMHRVEVHVFDHRTTATVRDKRGERAVAIGKASVGH